MNIDLKHVLVPTDFGEASAHALEMAIGLAERFGAKLTLLHAVYVPALAYANGGYVPVDDLEREAQSLMEAALARAKQRYGKIEGLVVSGDPRQRLLDVVKERGVDFIVMGTHGRRGFTRVLLGSVAEHIVRAAPVPVLTIGPRVAHAA